MKKLLMKEVVALSKNKQRLTTPGGWYLRVPEVTKLDPTTMKVYSRFHQTRGMVNVRAEQEVLDTFNDIWKTAWVRYQTNSVRYWMKKYAQRFPSKIAKDGSLIGFRPEWIQDTYVPGMNVGKAGKQGLSRLLQQMADES